MWVFNAKGRGVTGEWFQVLPFILCTAQPACCLRTEVNVPASHCGSWGRKALTPPSCPKPLPLRGLAERRERKALNLIIGCEYSTRSNYCHPLIRTPCTTIKAEEAWFPTPAGRDVVPVKGRQSVTTPQTLYFLPKNSEAVVSHPVGSARHSC